MPVLRTLVTPKVTTLAARIQKVLWQFTFVYAKAKEHAETAPLPTQEVMPDTVSGPW
jgi:hypothetical protein